jgi:hypothetical protein
LRFAYVPRNDPGRFLVSQRDEHLAPILRPHHNAGGCRSGPCVRMMSAW